MKKIITICLITITALFLIILKTKLNNEKYNIPKEELEILKEEIEPPKEEITKISVDIKGAVKKPGVYEIEDNKKVIDVINLAEGFTENADTSMINLAKKVANEMVIIIYTKEEVQKATEPNQIIKYIDKECICPQIKNDACINNNIQKQNTQSETTSKEDTSSIININTATVEELEKLTGIGRSKAEAIIAYREEKGLFNTIEELKEVPGIGETLYEKIKDNITV